jgi:glycosyltransferase involved in cell wall biosynthesis
MPANIRLTGFLNEKEFNAFYANASAAIVLTNREGTQPSGAAEAISLGVPLVISDIATTRRLYSDAAVFVQSDSSSIAKGVQHALNNQSELRERLKTLKEKLSAENSNQLLVFKEKLDRYISENL